MHGSSTILPLRARGLCFVKHGKRLLDDVGFELRAGERTVILGPNGAGKSLVLRLCHGLLEPCAGRIQWAESCPAPARRQGRKAHAMVFQRPVLLRRSVVANLKHALCLAGLGRRERRERAEAAMDRFGLTELAGRAARVLSGGEQQRLALARAWSLRPEVLFLDEPTAALDPAATRTIEEAIQTFHREGVKIVMTTHDLGQARRIADDVVFLHQGRLLEQTPAARFFEAPQSREAEAFLKGELLW